MVVPCRSACIVTDPPEVHLGDCFRPNNAPIFKTLNSFWTTTKFLQPHFNSISIMLDLPWFDLNFQPSSAKDKWKRRPVVLTKFCSSWDSDEYDELNVKSRNYYFSIFIYWNKRVQFGAFKSKKKFNWFQGTISGFNEHGQNSWDLLWNAP